MICCCFGLFDSEESFWSGRIAVRAAPEARGPWLQGGEPSRDLSWSLFLTLPSGNWTSDLWFLRVPTPYPQGWFLASSKSPYGDLTTISPTIISEKSLIVWKRHLARGVKFNVVFDTSRVGLNLYLVNLYYYYYYYCYYYYNHYYHYYCYCYYYY